jgi:hypothetical protein
VTTSLSVPRLSALDRTALPVFDAGLAEALEPSM